MPSERKEIAGLMDAVVVVDTSTPYVYVGTLKEWQDHFLVLVDADAHDTTEGRSGKDLYTLETARNGVQKNRRQVTIRKNLVVSISKLEDVILY